MSKALYFDVETVGRASCRPMIKAAKNLRDPAKIAADLEERASRMGLNPNFADIVALGVGFGDRPPVVHLCRTDDDRRGALAQFWAGWEFNPVRVGFNSLRYDLPVLIRQSQLLSVKYYPKDIDLNRYRANSIDLFNLLTWGYEVEGLSLVNYCRLFGREETAEDGTGAEVAGWVEAGEWDKVSTHCAEDIERTRWLAKRLGVVS